MTTSRILRKPAVLARVGLSYPTVWRLVRDGRFPRPVALGPNSRGWLESEIEAWIEARAAARDADGGRAA